jgi:hypothetical protein
MRKQTKNILIGAGIILAIVLIAFFGKDVFMVGTPYFLVEYATTTLINQDSTGSTFGFNNALNNLPTVGYSSAIDYNLKNEQAYSSSAELSMRISDFNELQVGTLFPGTITGTYEILENYQSGDQYARTENQNFNVECKLEKKGYKLISRSCYENEGCYHHYYPSGELNYTDNGGYGAYVVGLDCHVSGSTSACQSGKCMIRLPPGEIKVKILKIGVNLCAPTCAGSENICSTQTFSDGCIGVCQGTKDCSVIPPNYAWIYIIVSILAVGGLILLYFKR